MDGFEVAMEAQRSKGRAAAKFDASLAQRVQVEGKADFTGYDNVSDGATVVGLFDAEGDPVTRLDEGAAGVVTLDRTPFYGEAGGEQP